MALTNKLKNIANEIRNKTGKSDLLTLEQMATEIAAIEVGGGGSADIPEEAFKITGACQYKFAGSGWNWFIENYGHKITTEGITDAMYMFEGNSTLEEIPFDLNFDSSTYRDQGYMFNSCKQLKRIGKIKGLYPAQLQYLFYGCNNLEEIPEFIDLNMNRIHTYSYCNISSIFNGCNKLRRIPEEFLKQLYTPLATSRLYTIFTNGFSYCYVLDEIRGLNPQTGTMTSNIFSNTFLNCYRVKELIFATQEDGTPYSVNWSKQSIYSDIMGYGSKYSSFPGIDTSKEVTDDATYQALKNDPDWFTKDENYSRYNHDSAVNTINSLPDVTQGSGNTINFKSTQGSLTDGGAINTLTEEEIAVAAAKGWTVTLF